jgi:hypothetical protein
VKIITITSTAKLCCVVDAQLQDHEDTTVIYRGHGDIDYKLCPKAGRFGPPPKSKRETLNESLMLELFRRHSVGLTRQTPDDDWEFLAVAQHHGMATRLMDWTRSPLVAAYFAVAYPNVRYEKDESPPGTNSYIRREPDSVVYAWRCRKLDLSKAPPAKPHKIKQIVRYIPRHITAQSGLFSAHPDPKAVLNDSAMIHLIIPFDKRRDIKRSLYRLGIHEGTVFPDLDGAARHIEWLQTNKRP